MPDDRSPRSPFEGLWSGGYFEGDPLDPLSRSTYGQLGFMSVLHATYLRCIKPYLNRDTVALELGPGRGAWSRAMLPARELWALDVLPPEETHFFEYVGRHPHVRYIQVDDFECRQLPDDHFNFMFSFGCLCHVPFEGIEAYARNLFPKLKEGSDCFWLVGDFAKHNATVADWKRYSVWLRGGPVGRRYTPLKWALGALARVDHVTPPLPPESESPDTPGRWRDATIDRTCTMLEASGYDVVDRDVGTSLRDPIIHFRKPRQR